MEGTKKEKARKVLGLILMISLSGALIYTLVRFIISPADRPDDALFFKIKSDYLLMFLQCLLGIAVMSLPSILNKKWNIVLPTTVCILYYVFLYCAIFLGEVFKFYYIVPHWDTLMHAFSGAMLGALGFELVDFLNKDSHVKVSLSPFFVSLFAFCFALAMGSLWEIYEFAFDSFLGLNMQKHTTWEDIPLVGRLALADTMKDIIIDAIAAFAVAAIGFVTNRKKRKDPIAATFKEAPHQEEEASEAAKTEEAENIAEEIQEEAKEEATVSKG